MTPAQVWMHKETGDLFCALPLYYEEEVTVNEPRGENFSLPVRRTVYVMFGYVVDVGNDNDVSSGLCIKPEALRKKAICIGEL